IGALGDRRKSCGNAVAVADLLLSGVTSVVIFIYIEQRRLLYGIVTVIAVGPYHRIADRRVVRTFGRDVYYWAGAIAVTIVIHIEWKFVGHVDNHHAACTLATVGGLGAVVGTAYQRSVSG